MRSRPSVIFDLPFSHHSQNKALKTPFHNEFLEQFHRTRCLREGLVIRLHVTRKNNSGTRINRLECNELNAHTTINTVHLHCKYGFTRGFYEAPQ